MGGLHDENASTQRIDIVADLHLLHINFSNSDALQAVHPQVVRWAVQ
jgi:hypothetical protein